MATVETDWRKIPAEYQCTAVDQDGEKYAYRQEPYQLIDIWALRESCIMDACLNLGFARGRIYWRNTLRVRPA